MLSRPSILTVSSSSVFHFLAFRSIWKVVVFRSTGLVSSCWYPFPRWLGLAYNMSISDGLHLINSQMWRVISCQRCSDRCCSCCVFLLFFVFSRLRIPLGEALLFFLFLNWYLASSSDQLSACIDGRQCNTFQCHSHSADREE